ncbi:LON peptidase substrate-binding domain-containing protein [Enterovibrio sp. ZSDZ35]|uniref:LON peptidase substrate-binding domain-containing protein n=1 Tax=Enterovibrio qingdaonensis TaxID=2899818 RepID=A0ABT5QRS0_9GAMM|nr:LON peptidase substrate-binding domain-containing protein [Enterovibrio sp. ZSDZ35]MDD1783687.1 LON peptidase substrate-binding domain-containing protein [Enterovibrio sp. ZSDZ35]
MQLGLFPLPIFLLPNGITTLRIFEPRYVRLVKESMADNRGFVLAMREGDAICAYGTLVHIIDFEMLPDGLLGITIQGTSRVQLSDITQQNEDGLWVGEITSLPDWPTSEEQSGVLGDALGLLFESHPEHAAQYRQTLNLESLSWVCQRWLEILPLANQQRQWFLAQSDLDEAKSFISLLLTQENVELE